MNPYSLQENLNTLHFSDSTNTFLKHFQCAHLDMLRQEFCSYNTATVAIHEQVQIMTGGSLDYGRCTEKV